MEGFALFGYYRFRPKFMVNPKLQCIFHSHLISLSAVKNRGYYNTLRVRCVVAAVSLQSKAPKAIINRGK